MRVAIYGASGRVGVHLVEAILANPGLELAAALVSPKSAVLGSAVAGTAVEYREINPTFNARFDAIIDFSTPEASIYLQELLGTKPIPVVVGTTGFSEKEDQMFEQFAQHRRIMTGANFALGFEAFVASINQFAQSHPGADAAVAEIYHRRKKAVASGTSRRLAEEVSRARKLAGGDSALPPISVGRVGDTVGVNSVSFDLGVSKAEFTFTVETLAAYAEGALAAMRWLVQDAAEIGRYYPIDMLHTVPGKTGQESAGNLVE